jgi:tRNA(Arg) A34 adenosine deaminase TadA
VTTDRETRFIRRAIEIASRNVATGGGPFGAIVVKDDVVVAEGVNEVTSNHDPTAHAEIVAIRRACETLGTFQLDRCEVYASCEPCPMCLGAIYWARPERLYFAATREDAAAAGFDDEIIYRELARPPSDREIATRSLLREEGKEPLLAWIRNPSRRPY